MRRVLAALALLVAVVMLYQGLVTGGFIHGPAEPLPPEAATFLLTAGGAMVIGAVTMRWSAGIAAIEMALAGLVTIGIAAPTYRYLAAYGAVALILSLAAMLVDLVPRPPAARLRQVLVPPARVKQHDPTQAYHRQLLIRIEKVRAHQRAPIRRQRRDQAGGEPRCPPA